MAGLQEEDFGQLFNAVKQARDTGPGIAAAGDNYLAAKRAAFQQALEQANLGLAQDANTRGEADTQLKVLEASRPTTLVNPMTGQQTRLPGISGVSYTPHKGLTVAPDASAGAGTVKTTQGSVPIITHDQTDNKFYDTNHNEVNPTMVPSGAKIVEQSRSPVVTDAQMRMQKLNELLGSVGFFEKKLNELPVGKGLMGRVKGAEIYAQGVAQTDPKAAAYVSSVNGLRTQIARGIGDVGNIPEAERASVEKMIPTLTDNDETRAQKLQNFRDYIKAKQQAEQAALGAGGRPVQDQSTPAGPAPAPAGAPAPTAKPSITPEQARAALRRRGHF